MNIHPAIVAACLMGAILVSGLGKMNIIHHEELPKILADQQIVIEHSRSGILGLVGLKQIDIRMKQEIKDLDSIHAIVKALDDAKAGDLVVMYMAGIGGEVDAAMQIINAMHASKAYVKVIVEAPVYSAHALISVSGDELIMRPYSFLMFHTSSGYGTDCQLAEGTDRTVSNVEHCQAFLDTHLGMINKVITEAPVLTAEEKTRIMTGHDVYLTSEDVNKRKQ